MNEDVLAGKWRQLRGEVQRQWGKLTNDELDEINGQRERLLGKIQEKYGYARYQAEQEVNDFLAEWAD